MAFINPEVRAIVEQLDRASPQFPRDATATLPGAPTPAKSDAHWLE